MVFARGSGKVITLTMTTGEQCIKGFLYKITSDKATLITGKADEVVAVGFDDSVEADGVTAKTGKNEQFHMDGEVMVASVASQTYNVGQNVYADDTVDGMCTATDPTTATIIGRYMGKAPVTTSGTNGDLVPVCLDLMSKKVTS